MTRAAPTSPFARYPRLYARVKGMPIKEARMAVVAIIKTMPTLLREGYRGYKSARTRVIEAIQIRDWNEVYKSTERYLGGEQGWYEVYDLVVSDSEDEDSDYEEENGEENKFREEKRYKDEADDDDGDEDDNDSDDGYGDKGDETYDDDDDESEDEYDEADKDNVQTEPRENIIQTTVDDKEPQPKKEIL